MSKRIDLRSMAASTRQATRRFAGVYLAGSFLTGAYFAGGCAESRDADSKSDPLDAGTTATPPAPDAGCPDCELFPKKCAKGALCPVPLQLGDRTFLRSMSGSSSTDVWAVGNHGVAVHWDGTRWERSDTGTDLAFASVWRRSATETWIGTAALRTMFLRAPSAPFDGAVSSGDWSNVTTMPPENSKVVVHANRAMSGNMDSDWVWAATERWDEFGYIPDVGYGTTFHPGLVRLHRTTIGLEIAVFEARSGGPTYSSFNALSRVTDDVVFAVGELGAACEIRGVESQAPVFATMNSGTTSALFGVWARTNEDVWAVGAGGTVVRHRSTVNDQDLAVAWESIPIPVDSTLRAIAGTSESNVWVVGDDAVVLRWDGVDWRRIPIAGLDARRPDWTAIWISNDGHVWVAGEDLVLALETSENPSP